MHRKTASLLLAAAALWSAAAMPQTSTDNRTMMFSHSAMMPQPLMPGDRIAIVAPASIIKPERVYEAIPVLRDQGWEVTTGQNTFARHGTFAGTDAERLHDLKQALMSDSIDAVLCARGGYGVIRILDSIAALPLEDHQKWVIGFSDISALHALLTSRGIPSIHASMCEHISQGADDPDNAALFAILRGEGVNHRLAADPRNRIGEATGQLVGGNLSVIAGLIGTPYDVMRPGTILFVEDVNEPIYKLERIFYNLKMAGVLENLKGLIVGKFAKCMPDADYQSVESMIARMVKDYDYPVAFNVPVGHVSHNIPLVCGAMATLNVGKDEVRISQ